MDRYEGKEDHSAKAYQNSEPIYTPGILEVIAEIRRNAYGPPKVKKPPPRDFMKENIKMLKQMQIKNKEKRSNNFPPLRSPNRFSHIKPKVYEQNYPSACKAFVCPKCGLSNLSAFPEAAMQAATLTTNDLSSSAAPKINQSQCAELRVPKTLSGFPKASTKPVPILTSESTLHPSSSSTSKTASASHTSVCPECGFSNTSAFSKATTSKSNELLSFASSKTSQSNCAELGVPVTMKSAPTLTSESTIHPSSSSTSKTTALHATVCSECGSSNSAFSKVIEQAATSSNEPSSSALSKTTQSKCAELGAPKTSSHFHKAAMTSESMLHSSSYFKSKAASASHLNPQKGHQEKRFDRKMQCFSCFQRNRTKPLEPEKIVAPHPLGYLPSYIIDEKRMREERMIKEEEEKKEKAPKPLGLVRLPDKERLQTLESLQKTHQEFTLDLQKLPVRLEALTLKARKYKENLEKQLAMLEEGIEIFSKPMVFVRPDV